MHVFLRGSRVKDQLREAIPASQGLMVMTYPLILVEAFRPPCIYPLWLYQGGMLGLAPRVPAAKHTINSAQPLIIALTK